MGIPAVEADARVDGAPVAGRAEQPEISPRAAVDVLTTPHPDRHEYETRRAFPWAFLLSILIIIGVEVALRLSGWPKQVPYEIGFEEYPAVAAQIGLKPNGTKTLVQRARQALRTCIERRHA